MSPPGRKRPRRSVIRRVTYLLVVTASLLAPAHAAASSLVFIKEGNVWLAAPDGSRQTQLTTGGGYESPSQANDGTVVVVRRTTEGTRNPRRIYRMNRSGVLLNPPVEAVPVDNSQFIGPLGAEVSPDGRIVAYHYINNSPLVTKPGYPRLSFSYSDRNTSRGEITDAGWYLNPTWVDNDRAIAFTTGTIVYDSQIYSISGGSFTDWQQEDGGSLGSGDLSADGSRFAATMDGGEKIRLYSPAALPPGQPTPRCDITGAVGGKFESPTWSPDGGTLAWAEGDGIHVAAVSNLETCQMASSPTAVIPGGSVPFWGPADAPVPTGGNPGTGTGTGTAVDTSKPSISVTVPKTTLAKALKRGFTLKLTTSEAGSAKALALVSGRDAKLLRVRSKVAARGSRRLAGAGSYAVKLKFSAKARRVFRRRRTLGLTARIQVIDAANNRSAKSKRLVLRR